MYPASTVVIAVRLTHRCQALCEYCCCDTTDRQYLTLDIYQRVLDTLWQWWSKAGACPRHIEIEYFGGEVLTLPSEVLDGIVHHARQFFISKGITFRDGVQSNLIGSQRQISRLVALFGENIGSSVETFSDRRRVGGSAHAYKSLQVRGSEQVAGKNGRVPAVFTADAKTIVHAYEEAEEAVRHGYALTLRHVLPSRFSKHTVPVIDPMVMEQQYMRILRGWLLQWPVVIKPFYDLLGRRLAEHGFEHPETSNGCHFRTNCVSQSIHIEYDGSIYQCGELCDQGVGYHGHAGGDPDPNTWDMLFRRSSAIYQQCSNCDYFSSCQGGCMADSVAYNLSILDRSPFCNVWKAIFAEIDRCIAQHGDTAVFAWYRSLGKELLHAQHA